MPSERTFVTEVATGLGTTGGADLDLTISAAQPPAAFAGLSEAEWELLGDLYRGGRFAREFEAGWENGRAFLEADDALAGRRPRLVEWTGGRRPPGDEVVPADLRIDHVYLVSCKYLSQILQNASPARLVEGLLSTAPVADARDWFVRTAPAEYQALYEACLGEAGRAGMPMFAMSLSSRDRRRLATELRTGWPGGAEPLYRQMCDAVAAATAREWRRRVTQANAELLLWRVLRIGSVPYFVLGANPHGSVRLRIDTPWDWRRQFQFRTFEVEAQPGGQARVRWSASYEVRSSGEHRSVSGHVEIRWSHGRFSGPPEAKVYLDSPHEAVPGYHLL